MLGKSCFSGTALRFAAELPWRYGISTSLFHDQETFYMGICIKPDPLKFKREVENSLAIISAATRSRCSSRRRQHSPPSRPGTCLCTVRIPARGWAYPHLTRFFPALVADETTTESSNSCGSWWETEPFSSAPSKPVCGVVPPPLPGHGATRLGRR